MPLSAKSRRLVESTDLFVYATQQQARAARDLPELAPGTVAVVVESVAAVECGEQVVILGLMNRDNCWWRMPFVRCEYRGRAVELPRDALQPLEASW